LNVTLTQYNVLQLTDLFTNKNFCLFERSFGRFGPVTQTFDSAAG
jgi:hypothetical protein